MVLGRKKASSQITERLLNSILQALYLGNSYICEEVQDINSNRHGTRRISLLGVLISLMAHRRCRAEFTFPLKGSDVQGPFGGHRVS